MRRRYFGKKRRGSSRLKNIPLAPTIGVGVGLAAPALYAYNQGGTAKDLVINYGRGLSYNTTGFDPVTNSFGWNGLPRFYGPILIGAGMHKLMNWIGVNRLLAKSKMGFVI